MGAKKKSESIIKDIKRRTRSEQSELSVLVPFSGMDRITSEQSEGVIPSLTQPRM